MSLEIVTQDPNVRSQDVDPDPRNDLTDDEALILGTDRFEASRTWRKEFDEEFRRYYQLYRSYIEMTEWPFATALFIPMIFATIESYLPRLVAQRPRIKVEPRNESDLAAANLHRELLDYQWDYIGMPVTIVEFVKDVLIYGTGFLKVGWRTDVREMSFRGGNGEEGRREVTVYDDPVVDNVSIEDIFPDPTGTDIADARYICHRYWMEWAELDAMADLGGSPWIKANVAKLKEVRRTELERLNDVIKEEKDDGQRAVLESQRARIWTFEVVEYWEDDRWIVFAVEPNVLLVNTDNPYWHKKKPFIRAVDNVLSNEFYGIGEAEMLESLNVEMNTLSNLTIEEAKRLVLQMFTIKRGRGILPEDVLFQPQGGIMVDEHDDLRPIFQGDIKMSAYRNIDQLRVLFQEVSGSTDNFKGLASNLGSETATGASILAQAAASRAGLKFQLLTEMALRPLGRMLLSLNEQHIEHDRMITIVGDEAELVQKRLTPADLARSGAELDVRIDIGATDPVSRELKTQRIITAIQVAGQIMPAIPQLLGPIMKTLLLRLLELLEIPISQELMDAAPDIIGPLTQGDRPAPTTQVAATAQQGQTPSLAQGLSLAAPSQPGVGPVPGILPAAET